MPRTATETTKTARKESAAKSKTEKTKRPPSAYNIYMGANLKKYKEAHPDVAHKDAFTAVAQLWADAPENPNKGKSKTEKENKPKKSKKEAPVSSEGEADDADE